MLWTEPAVFTKAVAGAVHGATGLAGGLGAIALITLLTPESGTNRRCVVTAIQALGQRSLTFYLFQSVVFVAVFAPFAGGLGGRTSFAGAAVVAIATWLASIALADLMRRTSYRGPPRSSSAA